MKVTFHHYIALINVGRIPGESIVHVLVVLSDNRLPFELKNARNRQKIMNRNIYIYI